MKKLSQRGFTLVEGLLLIIALSLVVGVGYYVVSANKQVTNTVSTAAKSKIVANPKKFLEVKELGIKIPVNGALSAATYVISPADNNYVAISTPEFSKAITACTSKDSSSATSTALGLVSKYQGNYDSNAALNSFFDEFIKQFPGFYIDYGHADGGLCNGNDPVKTQAAKALFDKLDPQLKAAVKQATAL